MRRGLDARAEPPLPGRGGSISNAANEITKFRDQGVGGLAGNFGRPQVPWRGPHGSGLVARGIPISPQASAALSSIPIYLQGILDTFPVAHCASASPQIESGRARARQVIPHLHLCVCLRARGESANLSVARRKHSGTPPPRPRRITHAAPRAPYGGPIADSDTYATVAR